MSKKTVKENDKEVSKNYVGLARKYRPQTFEEVIGQPHIVRTLKKAVETNHVAPAYLFIGSRGLGKTTMARILAKALNCEKGITSTPCGKCESCIEISRSNHIDVLEIDAASNTGIDNVRETIIQSVSTVPAKGRYKVFIIDETHMLSAQAFGALLKTIEEPPSHVVFIMATTEGHKVPSPIRSRCLRFDFRPVSSDELTERLKKIAKAESIDIEESAVRLICEYSEGGVRDAISALDMVRAYSSDKINLKDTEEVLGAIPSVSIEKLMNSIAVADSENAENILKELWEFGVDTSEVMRALLFAFRKELFDVIRGSDKNFKKGRIVRSIESILFSMERTRYSRHPLIELELLIAKLSSISNDEKTLKELYEKLLNYETFKSIREDTAIEPEQKTVKKIETSREWDKKKLLSIFRKEEFFSELKAASPNSEKYCRDAEISIPKDGTLKLLFKDKTLFERFEKDHKAIADIKHAIEFVQTGKFHIEFELSAQSKPQQIQKELNFEDEKSSDKSKAEDLDPEIEKIKRLFGADSVEIVKE